MDAETPSAIKKLKENQMAKEVIKVKQLSKFGVQLEDGVYVNWSKKIKDAEKGKIVPGGVYTVDMFRAESGKGYINSVVSLNNSAAPAVKGELTAVIPSVPKAIDREPKAFLKTEVKSEGMSKAEWANKDRSQLIGGLSHDAATLAAAAATANVSLEQLLFDYTKALDEMLRVRDLVK